jgi:hypothetical protein
MESAKCKVKNGPALTFYLLHWRFFILQSPLSPRPLRSLRLVFSACRPSWPERAKNTEGAPARLKAETPDSQDVIDTDVANVPGFTANAAVPAGLGGTWAA